MTTPRGRRRWLLDNPIEVNGKSFSCPNLSFEISWNDIPDGVYDVIILERIPKRRGGKG